MPLWGGIIQRMNVINMDEYRKLVPTKQNKYKNKKTWYNNVLYDSKREANYRQQLDMLSSSSVPTKERVSSIEEQVRYKMIVNDIKICTYVLDFKVTYADGRIEHVDVKGMLTGVYKLKKKLMLACHDINIVEV